jgi:cytoskeletal protein RodZ
MVDIGFRLQQARLQRAITLRQVSNATKIPLSVLEALERSDFSRLPGGIFTRGYIRAYANEVGLDAEALVEELDELLGDVAPSGEDGTPSDEDEASTMRSTVTGNSLDKSRLSFALLPVVLLASVVVLVWKSVESPSAPDVPVLREFDADAVSPDDAAVSYDATGKPEALRAAATESEPALVNQQTLRLELRPRGPCWVSASADGRLMVYRLMQPGEHVTVDARDEIVLRVGDAGAFAYLINGVPGRPLGRSGQVVTLRITGGNYEALQATMPRDDARPGAPL